MNTSAYCCYLALSITLTLGPVSQSFADDADDIKQLTEIPLEDLLNIKITSVTKNEISLSQAPAVISVVTADVIDKYDMHSLADVLKVLPGIDVLNDLTTYNAGIRGINAGLNGQSQLFKIMLDGQDMAFRPTTGNFIGPEFIPTIAIDRVEVIRGPLSALYGANAFLGTVNVVPKTATQSQGLYGITDLSYIDDFGNNGYQVQLGLGNKINNFSFFSALSVQDRDRSGLALPASSPRYSNLILQDKRVSKKDNEETASFYIRADYETLSLGHLSFNFLYQSFDRTGNFQPDSEPLSNAQVGYDNSMAHLKWKKSVSDQLSLTANLAVNKGSTHDTNRQYDPFRAGFDYGYRDYGSTQYNGSVVINYDYSPSITLVSGLDYSFDQEDLATLILVDDTGAKERLNADRYAEIDNEGVFLQLGWHPSDNWHLIAGVRRDSHSIYDQQTTYRAGIVYNYSKHTTFKLLTGTSFKAPPVMLMFGGQHPRFLGPLPNSSLAPQQAVTTEFNIGTAFSQNTRLSATVYDTHITDFAEYDTLAANPQAKNRSKISSQGLELELRYRSFDPAIDAFLSYSYATTDVSTDSVVGIQVSDQTRLYPEHSFSAGLNYTFSDSYTLFAQWFYFDERAADKSNLPFLPLAQQQEYYLNAYSILDLGLDITDMAWLPAQHSRLRFSVRNSLEKSYTEPGFSGIDVPGLGRQIYLTYRQTF